MIDSLSNREQLYWRHPCFDELALFRARFTSHRYAPHTHPTYVLALITAGCERIRIDRTPVLAPEGTIAVVHPEEWHDGEKGAEDGWSYRTFYPSVALTESVGLELGRRGAPVFSRRLINDPDLAATLGAAHSLAATSDRFAAEVSLLTGLAQLISRHADPDGSAEDIARSNAGLRFGIYRDFIESNLQSNFTMRALAAAAGVSRFQVIRDFRNVIGQAPSTYVRVRRVRRAFGLMRQGRSPAEAAADAGFADQSHLSRTFRATYGITPGAFRKAWR